MVATLIPKIRESRAEDSTRVVAIWCAAVDATHDFLSAADRAAIETEVRDFLPDAPLWLTVDSNDVATGFMLVDGTHMEALFVDPAFRGSGIGRTLVDHALKMAPELTTDVNEQNQQAVGFYRHLGFIPTGRSALDGQGRPYPLVHLKHG